MTRHPGRLGRLRELSGGVRPSMSGVVRVATAAGFGLVLLVLVTLYCPPGGSAASPEASAAGGGDTRSAGEGPGLVGAPFLAIGGVVLLGVATAGLTGLYVRATGGASRRIASPDARPADERPGERQ